MIRLSTRPRQSAADLAQSFVSGEPRAKARGSKGSRPLKGALAEGMAAPPAPKRLEPRASARGSPDRAAASHDVDCGKRLKHLALVALLLIGARARADFMQSMASPGPLAAAHAALDGKCDACHVPFKGIPSSACLACHTATRARMQSGIGTHAAFEKQGKKCVACHPDHKGRAHALSPPLERAFDHALTGFVLDGKHRAIACEACHRPGASGPQWVGLAKECAGCHRDAHQGTLGARCAACHNSMAWKPATRTKADHKVSMTGGHSNLNCNQCHSKGAHLTATSSCGDCHEQKHGGTRAPCATCHNTNDWKSASFTHDFCTCILPGKHQTAPCLGCHPAFKFTPTPFACAACHLKDRKHDDLGACSRCHSALSWKQKTFDHNRPSVGFKIEGKHLEVGCENCHKVKNVFKGVPKNCEGCHKVPAHGDFGACAQCHFVAGWQKQSFSHDKTAFPLDGEHAKVSCQGCHGKFAKGTFKKGPNECTLCHSDPHKGQFAAPQQKAQARVWLAAAEPPKHLFSGALGCLDCHTTRAWTPSTIDVARHQSFRYPLRGLHQQVACARCHEDGVFMGTPSTCRSCHVDRHRGRLGNECEKCHDESGWKHHPGFDHFAATGFALEKAHAGVPCVQCHGEDHQRLAAVKQVTCATCHTPLHGEQFGRDCTHCHKPTRFADVPEFDHGRTMFPLDRRHRAVRCTTCHDARRGVRLDPDCRTCHGDPHRGRTQSDCGECHRADRWSLVRFDHDRTIFPLRGRHFTTPCRDCHTNDQYTGTRPECVSCHRGDRTRADSLHMDHRTFPIDCSECHKAFKW
jgi:hypothetical protein